MTANSDCPPWQAEESETRQASHGNTHSKHIAHVLQVLPYVFATIIIAVLTFSLLTVFTNILVSDNIEHVTLTVFNALPRSASMSLAYTDEAYMNQNRRRLKDVDNEQTIHHAYILDCNQCQEYFSHVVTQIDQLWQKVTADTQPYESDCIAQLENITANLNEQLATYKQSKNSKASPNWADLWHGYRELRVFFALLSVGYLQINVPAVTVIPSE